MYHIGYISPSFWWDYQGRTTKNIELFSKLNAGLRKVRSLPQRGQEIGKLVILAKQRSDNIVNSKKD